MNSIYATRRFDGKLSHKSLAIENKRFAGMRGVSRGARTLGLVPGFLGTAAGRKYRSRFSDWRPEPLHILDGLPEEVRLSALHGFLGAGGQGPFYTREEAAALSARTAL